MSPIAPTQARQSRAYVLWCRRPGRPLRGRYGRDVERREEQSTAQQDAPDDQYTTDADAAWMADPTSDIHEMDATPAATAPRADPSPTSARAPSQPGRRARRIGRAIDAIGMAEGGLLTDVAIILDLAAIYVPLFGAVFDPAVPAPFAILYLRRGARVTWLAIIVATFLMTVLTGPHFGWRLGLRGVVGLFLGWAMKQRWRTASTLTLATLITTVTAVAAAFLVILLTGLPLQDLASELRNALGSAAWFASTAAQIVGLHGYWMLLRPSLVIVGDFSLRYWPFMFFAYTACVALPSAILYYAVANTAARVLGHEVIPFPPRWVMWLFRAFYLVVILPVGFVLRALWFIVTLPIHIPIWLWRLIRPKRSPFAPRAPRPESLDAPVSSASRIGAVGQSLATATPITSDEGGHSASPDVVALRATTGADVATGELRPSPELVAVTTPLNMQAPTTTPAEAERERR